MTDEENTNKIMNDYNRHPIITGLVVGVISLSSLCYLSNPLKFARKIELPTHYIAVDIDGNGKKDDGFALGYNNSKYVELYVKVGDKSQKINDAKGLELKLAHNKLQEDLETARNNHKQSLEKIKEKTANIENRLKETKAESN